MLNFRHSCLACNYSRGTLASKICNSSRFFVATLLAFDLCDYLMRTQSMGTGKTHPDESSFIKTCRSSTTVARVLGKVPAHLKMLLLMTILSHLPRLFFEPI